MAAILPLSGRTPGNLNEPSRPAGPFQSLAADGAASIRIAVPDSFQMPVIDPMAENNAEIVLAVIRRNTQHIAQAQGEATAVRWTALSPVNQEGSAAGFNFNPALIGRRGHRLAGEIIGTGGVLRVAKGGRACRNGPSATRAGIATLRGKAHIVRRHALSTGDGQRRRRGWWAR